MTILLFGATGMIGQGVLRECLLAEDVVRVLAVGRSPTGSSHPKLEEIVHPDLFDLAPIADRLAGFDACFDCRGVSVAGMSEERYRHIIHDMTLASARVLAELHPGMRLTWVSGQGTDATGSARMMWARVKGTTENALLSLPLDAYMFRPGFIQPLHGITSRTFAYRAIYTLAAPFMPLLRALFPKSIITTEQLGRAMLHVARSGAPKHILEVADIVALAD
jgi:uncharacterized protein YbjT (DUF2867 family)